MSTENETTVNDIDSNFDFEVYLKKIKEFQEFQAKAPLICCLCNKKFTGFEIKDPYPLRDYGACCCDCYTHKVVPARLQLALKVKDQYHSSRKEDEI